MEHHKLSNRSKAVLARVHKDLAALAEDALKLSPYDFGIDPNSVRDMTRQKELVAQGKSLTLNSRHLVISDADVSHAIDLIVYDEDGKVTWEIGYFRKVAQAFVTAAIARGVQIELGCLWESFVDGPHIELSRGYYK